MVVIVVSGQSTCGSTSTAKLLAEKLGLRYFSLGERFKSKFKKNAVGDTEAAVEGIKGEKGSSKDFHEDSDELQVKEAEKGNVVIDSKLGIHFVGDRADLKVWLEASPEVRVQRVAKREGIGLNEARKQLEEKDRLERNLFEKLYGFDFFDLGKKADLVLDVSDDTPEDTVNKIIEEMKRRRLV